MQVLLEKGSEAGGSEKNAKKLSEKRRSRRGFVFFRHAPKSHHRTSKHTGDFVALIVLS